MWKIFVLWNEMILDFNVISFMTWDKELNSEMTSFLLFFILGISKK